MNLTIRTDCAGIEGKEIQQFLENVGMATCTPDTHIRAFEKSYAVIFIYEGDKLMGFGRAISDGEYQAALYDIAVHPDSQGKGMGKIIIQELLKKLPNCNVILYATPGMEGFYEKLGFGLMTTGMAIFTTDSAMKKFTTSNYRN